MLPYTSLKSTAYTTYMAALPTVENSGFLYVTYGSASDKVSLQSLLYAHFFNTPTGFEGFHPEL